jgi:hypothetical protein
MGGIDAAAIRPDAARATIQCALRRAVSTTKCTTLHFGDFAIVELVDDFARVWKSSTLRGRVLNYSEPGLQLLPRGRALNVE